jgi:lipopolysaccharide cholinephosphotransferase
MRQIDTRDLQLMKLKILELINDICEKEQIRYFLAYGTLIGAVREKGFIPWDEDIDIFMLREDYTRFCRVAGQYLGNSYFLQNSETDKYFLIPITRICIEGTYRQPGIPDAPYHTGTFVDIFPLDKVSENKQSTLIQYKKIKRHLKVWKHKIGCAESNTLFKTIAKSILKLLLHLVPMNYLKHSVNKAIFSSKSCSSAVVCSLAGGCGADRETFKEEWFYESVKKEFEGSEFPVPIGYHELLTHYYGDYMTPPKKSDQRKDPPSYMLD